MRSFSRCWRISRNSLYRIKLIKKPIDLMGFLKIIEKDRSNYSSSLKPALNLYNFPKFRISDGDFAL